MSVYTKTGDKGLTGLLTGGRIEKDSLRVEAYGSVDEITSALGLARSCCEKPEVRDEIFNLQKFLMLIMAELASINTETSYVTTEHVNTLECTIDRFESMLPPLNHFIIPGGKTGAAALDLARTVTRRGERQVLRLLRKEPVNEQVMIALNRLSDLCFVLMRFEEQENI